MTDGFVDQEALKELLERAEAALRPLGLTVAQSGFQVDPEHGMVLHLAALVRDSAAQGVQEASDDKAAFNQMMAAEHEMEIERQKQEMLAAMENPDLLFADDGEDDDG